MKYQNGAENYNIPKGYLNKGGNNILASHVLKAHLYFVLFDWFVLACKWYLQRTPQDPRSVKETL